jgi:hypothetical protein
MDTVGNFYVIFFVALVVAGPVFGLMGLRFYEFALEIGPRFMAVVVLLSFAAVPAVMLLQLIANPEFLLTDHQEQAMWGLLIGFLGLVGVGIALVLESRFSAKGETAEKEADIATSPPDLTKLRAARDVAGDACIMLFRRLRRLPKEELEAPVGTREAYACRWLGDVAISLAKIVDILDGTKQLSLEDDEVREVVADMLERIEDCGETDEIIALKRTTHSRVLH